MNLCLVVNCVCAGARLEQYLDQLHASIAHVLGARERQREVQRVVALEGRKVHIRALVHEHLHRGHVAVQQRELGEVLKRSAPYYITI